MWGFVFVNMVFLFGAVSGFLVWGRVVAATLRITQAVLASRGRGNCYVDDTILLLKGFNSAERCRTPSLVVWLWRVLGLENAWH